MVTDTVALHEGIGNYGQGSRDAAHAQESISARSTQDALESSPWDGRDATGHVSERTH